MKRKILLSGMTCGHCVKRVENALLAVEGVVSVIVSLEEKSAIVEANKDIDENLLREAIDEVGYDVDSIQ